MSRKFQQFRNSHVILLGYFDYSSNIANILLRFGVGRCSIITSIENEHRNLADDKLKIIELSTFTNEVCTSFDILVDTSTHIEEKSMVWKMALQRNSAILNCKGFTPELYQQGSFIFCMGNMKQFPTEELDGEEVFMLHKLQYCNTINYDNIVCIQAIPLPNINATTTTSKRRLSVSSFPTLAHFISGITLNYLRFKQKHPHTTLSSAISQRAYCTNAQKLLSASQDPIVGNLSNDEEESCCRYCHFPLRCSNNETQDVKAVTGNDSKCETDKGLDNAFESLYSTIPPYSSSYPLIDAHCHIQLGPLANKERSITAIELANRHYHVHTMVTCGVAPGDDWKRIEALSIHYLDCLLPNYGVHPWYISQLYAYERSTSIKPVPSNNEEHNSVDVISDQAHWYKELERLLQQYPKAGVGECGVDKNVMKHNNNINTIDCENESIPELTLELQIAIFEAQIRLACNYQRTLTIHGVTGCWGHIFQSLQKTIPLPAQRQSKRKQQQQQQQQLQGEDMGEQVYNRPKNIILHSCQSMPLEMIKTFQATFHDVYFSISASALNSDKMKMIVNAIPLDRLLLESDSPDQLPKALKSDERFTHNEPSIMLYIYHSIAKVRKIPTEELIMNIYSNCQRVFSIVN